MTLISSEAERLSLIVGQVLYLTSMEEGLMVMEPMFCIANVSSYFSFLSELATWG